MEAVATGGPIELAVVVRFVDVATDALAEAREEIDALNVYPIPDGDTGTNMYLTVSAARDAVRKAADEGADLSNALAAFRRGALLGARGNSGVILSEMLGAIASRIASADPTERNASVMADALRCATDASYAAVGSPQEGTILSVARAASDASLASAAQGQARARDVFSAAAASARAALARTPDQLQVLKDAGVVDAGGRGLCVILDAAETVLTGRRPVPTKASIGSHRIPVLPAAGADLTEGGPAYEVMYLLDAAPDAIETLKSALSTLGDSLVVVGGEGLYNVHVHVDDVGAAIEAGIAAGRPHRIQVTHFADQIAARPTTRTGRRIVAVAAGPGLTELFEEAGARVIVGGPGHRPSTGMFVDAIEECGAQEVVILPNDSDSMKSAEIAARTAESDHGVRVAVIPTESQVQGLAAIAVHEPARAFDQDVLAMTSSARFARHGAVTVAAKQAMTMAGPCEPGDVLGVIAGDFAVVGTDLFDVSIDVIERLLGSGGELITLVTGADGGDLATRVAARLQASHPAVETAVYDGGQARYPLLICVE